MNKTFIGFLGVLSLGVVFVAPSVTHAGWVGTPSTVDVTASPPSVTSGNSTTISWAVSVIKPAQSPHNPALGCTKSGAWSGFVADTDGGYSGSQSSGNLTSNKTYSISCLVPGGDGSYMTITDSVTVGVDAPTPPDENLPENGYCGTFHGATLSSHPTTGTNDGTGRYVCSQSWDYSNSYTGHTDVGDFWNWKCKGQYGGADAFCWAYKTGATFDLSTYVVSGSGEITAPTGGGINCGTVGTDCEQAYAPNTQVRLRGTPATGYQIDRNAGDFIGVTCNSGGSSNECTFTMSGDKTVGVRFRPITYTLYTRIGTGSGRIEGYAPLTPEYISCTRISSQSACQDTINMDDTPVELHAIGSLGQVFFSWTTLPSSATGGTTASGACNGQSKDCTFTMSGRRSAAANFVSAPIYNLTASVSPSGAGTITLSPVGTSCGTGCAQFTSGDQVTLTATPSSSSYSFGSWDATGACSGQPNPCVVNMNAHKSVVANFTPITHTKSLNYSLSSNRSNPLPLDGATISLNTNVYVFTSVSPTNDVSSVLFNLNGGSAANCSTGTHDSGVKCFHSDTTSPYDLVGGTSLTATRFYFTQSGTHTITSDLDYTVLPTEYLSATFSVPPSLVNGVCGTSSGGTAIPAEPTTNPGACNPGTYNGSSPADDPSTWRWTCAGSGGGASPTCSAPNSNYVELSVSCVGGPSPSLIHQNVTWTATPVGGTQPYSYIWTGTGFPSPSPTTNPLIVTYGTVGLKTAQVSVNGGSPVPCSTDNGGSVQVIFDPSFEEF